MKSIVTGTLDGGKARPDRLEWFDDRSCHSEVRKGIKQLQKLGLGPNPYAAQDNS
jgi:hypothetical protein